MERFGMGQAFRRVEDIELLTGQRTYTDDISLPGQAHLVVLRSPLAHGEIRSIEVEDAKAMPGVLAVLTVADLDAAGIADIPCMRTIEGAGGKANVAPGHPVLARGRVRHVGDPVAAVIAETEAQARDAAEAILVDYEDLDPVVEMEEAIAEGAPVIWPEAANNVALDWRTGDEAAVEAAFAKAAHRVSLKLVNNRIVVNSMETRNAVGEYDAEADVMTLHTGSQGVHGLRDQLAQKIFDVSKEKLRVKTPEVGGGFGMKIFLYAEQVLVLHAAKLLGRPVKWSSDRGEAFQSDSQGRAHISTGEMAFDAQGRILAYRIDSLADFGAYISNFAPYVATIAGARMYPGVYNVPALSARVRCVFTNTVPVDAYRGAGRPEAAYLVERMMDTAAYELGLDRAEIRRINYVKPEELPHTTAMGMTYDSGDFTRLLDEALRQADREGFEVRRAEARKRGKLRGLGFASYIECCAGIGEEEARVVLEETGDVTLYIGTQNNGQGHVTVYTQILAERLGLDPARIQVRQGDSEALTFGGGTGGSRGALMGIGASSLAADKAIEKAKIVAGQLLEASVADIEFGPANSAQGSPGESRTEGRFRVVGTDREVTWSEVAAAFARPEVIEALPEEAREGINETARYVAPPLTYPNGCHAVELEIDEATGTVEIVNYTIVDDMGRIVNPLLLEGQIHGGTVQGLGQALMESTVYEAGSGQLLTGSFMDYALPRAEDVPGFKVTFIQDTPCTTNPLGIKGAGEAGAIGAPPATINAIVDALSHLGIKHVDMPATPAKLWGLINGAA